MKKINLFLLLTLLIFNINPLNSTISNAIQTKHPSLRDAINWLKSFPESYQVVEESLKEGSITVEISNGNMPFEAMWNSAARKVVIAKRCRNDRGALLRHLLFELTNAISESRYQELYTMAIAGRIDCDSYVEAVERIEHENMIRTVNIIEKGIASGRFPASASWTIVYDFAIHYKIQQLAGHSLLIAEEYWDTTRNSGFSRYRGTVKNLNRLSKKEKVSLLQQLHRDYFQPGRKLMKI